MSEPTFTCTKCGKPKPLSEFYRHPKGANGHEIRCKVCRNKAAVVRVREWRLRTPLTTQQRKADRAAPQSKQEHFGDPVEYRAKWLAIARGEIPFPEE